MDHDERTNGSPDDAPVDAPALDTAPPSPLPPDAPVFAAERIRSLDVLRGVAVLGILMVNVWTFAMPFPAAMNPELPGYDQGADRAAWWLVGLVFYSKMMPVFSMLFGAGIILFTSRVEARGGRSGRRWFARQGWLWVIGLMHAYLLWNGDILVPYAVVGLILYRLRRLRPRTLVVLAVVAMLLPKAGMYGLGEFLGMVRDTAVEAQALQEAGQEPTGQQVQFLEIWQASSGEWSPEAAKLEEIAAVMRGGYGGIFRRAGSELLMMHLVFYPLAGSWGIAGLMLLGMALHKTGMLTAARSDRCYARLAVIGYGVGLPGTWWGLRELGAHFDDIARVLQGGFILTETFGTVVALGHIGLVMLAVRRGWLLRLQERLAAAGRMAFTNYLAQTVIGVLLFYGYGLGLFGRVGRAEQLLVVLGVWLLQLWWSPRWLARYRFGPAEWLWRSLTYGRRQGLRRGAPVRHVTAA
ncbi:MAG: DUF418 domain-containing protein [Candidatus Krumholzibacteriia bacterium]